MVGTRMDGCYYSFDSGLLIDKAVIYHPLSEHFMQVEGSDIRIIAQMPIRLSQLVEFKKAPCYTCYDPLVETLSPDNEELVWDSFHTAPVTEESEYGTPTLTGRKDECSRNPK